MAKLGFRSFGACQTGVGGGACCPGCCSRSDSFSGDSLSADWAANANWSVSGGVLRTSTTGSILKFTNTCKYMGGFAILKFLDLQAGNVYRFGYGCGTSTAFSAYLQVTINAGGTMDMVLGADSAAGVAATIGGQIQVTLCLGVTYMNDIASTGPTFPLWDEITPCTSGSPIWFGIEVVTMGSGVTEVTFDDFSHLEHCVTNPSCDGCVCNCDGYAIPRDLIVTLHDDAGCAAIEGVELSMTYTSSCVWDSEKWTCGSSPGTEVFFRLDGRGQQAGCDGADPWQLSMLQWGTATLLQTMHPLTGTCNPLSWTSQAVTNPQFYWPPQGCCEGITDDPTCPDIDPGPPVYRYCPGRFYVSIAPA